MDSNDLKFGLELLTRVEEIVSDVDSQPDPSAAKQLAEALAMARSSLLLMLGVQSLPVAASMDPMKTALRVLTAYAEHTIPEPADLATLVRICGHRPAGMGWDEFACETLQRVLRDRAAAREFMAVGATAAR